MYVCVCSYVFAAENGQYDCEVNEEVGVIVFPLSSSEMGG